MKIQKHIHKDLLASCFHINGVGREVPENLRADVKSLWEKLITLIDGKPEFDDKEIELTPSEIVVAKMFYDTKNGIWPWNIPDEILQEFKDIFYPPKPLPTENV